MSKAAPLNSTVEIVKENGHSYAIKRYRPEGKYTAKEEEESYRNLSKMLEKYAFARTAKVIEYDEYNKFLRLEFIPGLTLREKLYKGEFELLELYKKQFIEVFCEARKEGINFDSDPSNIMFDKDGFVFIDPVCVNIELKDFVFVVYMWGLVKVALRNHNIRSISKMRNLWCAYYKDYLKQVKVDKKEFNKEMIAYISLVQNWNRERNAVEGLLVYLFRRLVFNNVYSLVKQVFRWNFIRC